MGNELMVFMNERFGEVRMVKVDGKPYAVASDVAKALGYKNTSDAINKHCKGIVKCDTPTNGGNQQMNVIPQGDIIRLAVKCPLEGAEEFESWIFDKVIPEIMNTGSYILDNSKAEKVAVGKVMANADFEMLEFVQGMVAQQLELKKNILLLEQEKELLIDENIHKGNVIIELVDNTDLAQKRQRLNDIMKFNFKNGKHQADKWNLLYREFERKYHVNLQQRMDRDNKTMKPKFKNKLDYIDRAMDMISQTYELACKIFENDVEKLKSQWFDTVSR